MEVRRVERLSDDVMNALCERLDRDCKDSKVKWDDCAIDCGSVDFKESNERVDRRVRYFEVVLSNVGG
jgi:hypothetical protein